MKHSFKRALAIVICVSMCPLAGTALGATPQAPKKNVKYVVTPQVVTTMVRRNDSAATASPVTTTSSNGGGGIFGNPNFLMLALGGAVVISGIALLASGVFNRQPASANTTSTQVASDFVNGNTYTPPANIPPKTTPTTPADIPDVTVKADDPQIATKPSNAPGTDLALNPVLNGPSIGSNQQQNPPKADTTKTPPATPIATTSTDPAKKADTAPTPPKDIPTSPLSCIDNASQLSKAAPQLQKVIEQMGGEKNMNAEWNTTGTKPQLKAPFLVSYNVSVFFHSGPTGLYGMIVDKTDKNAKPFYQKASVCVDPNDAKSIKFVVHQIDGTDKVSTITPGKDLNHISITSADMTSGFSIPFNRIGDSTNGTGSASQVADIGAH